MKTTESSTRSVVYSFLLAVEIALALLVQECASLNCEEPGSRGYSAGEPNWNAILPITQKAISLAFVLRFPRRTALRFAGRTTLRVAL
jgi:hypothetical protein